MPLKRRYDASISHVKCGPALAAGIERRFNGNGSSGPSSQMSLMPVLSLPCPMFSGVFSNTTGTCCMTSLPLAVRRYCSG